MVGEDEMCEPEYDSGTPPHLKRPEDVLVPRAEEREQGRRHGCDPRPHSGAPHHLFDQDYSCQVKQDGDQLLRHIGTKPEQLPQQPVDENREGGPVLVVRAEEVAQISCAPTGEKVQSSRKNHWLWPNTTNKTSPTPRTAMNASRAS
jgi:hypothetical protein